MTQDNARLALLIAGIWGGMIIVIIGLEAILHDGAVTAVVVDTFAKVLFGLSAIVAAVTGVAKFAEAKIIQSNNETGNGNASTPASTRASDPAGLSQAAGQIDGPAI